MNNEQTESNNKLDKIRNKWIAISTELNKQYEKACFAGIAIIWMILATDSYKLQPNLVLALLFFILPILYFTVVNLYQLFMSYYQIKNAKSKIEQGKRLKSVHLEPAKFELFASSIIFTLITFDYFFLFLYIYKYIMILK